MDQCCNADTSDADVANENEQVASTSGKENSRLRMETKGCSSAPRMYPTFSHKHPNCRVQDETKENG